MSPQKCTDDKNHMFSLKRVEEGKQYIFQIKFTKGKSHNLYLRPIGNILLDDVSYKADESRKMAKLLVTLTLGLGIEMSLHQNNIRNIRNIVCDHRACGVCMANG
eukprot:1595978-Pyramimonas_sp.AAC.1